MAQLKQKLAMIGERAKFQEMAAVVSAAKPEAVDNPGGTA